MTPALVVATIAVTHGLTPRDITGRGRSARLCLARAEAAHAMRHDLGMSQEEIGRVLRRDRSTVSWMLDPDAGRARQEAYERRVG